MLENYPKYIIEESGEKKKKKRQNSVAAFGEENEGVRTGRKESWRKSPVLCSTARGGPRALGLSLVPACVSLRLVRSRQSGGQKTRGPEKP